MRNISIFINERLILNPQSKIHKFKIDVKKNQLNLIEKYKDKIISYLSEPKSGEKYKFKWIKNTDAEDALDRFEGRGYTIDTPLKNEDKKRMIDLISKYGGWEWYFQSTGWKSSYKCLVTFREEGDKFLCTIMGGYNGEWTMSGEDYVEGKYKFDEFEVQP